MQHIRQKLHKGNPQILTNHIHRINQRPTLIRKNGLHIPGRDDSLRERQDQQNVTADGTDGTPLLLALLLFFGQTSQIARRDIASTQAIPETAYRVGTPRVGKHRGAFCFWHRLQLIAPFVVFN
ncbi:Uncharacterised protein [Shigella sonnei]|nr:Uncharacterised protein [Shigella sonnei]CSE49043.1 Uncharacterised protein [Shigella sonnei]CSE50368.1 Uncharacterised protein [Shigella sonnei]CSE64908.1 Uncharacterised protein [Shigella sonnei]CSF71961.1 Uncharacterised protein [Shigella sonnei]